jgi:hypothetical protein
MFTCTVVEYLRTINRRAARSRGVPQESSYAIVETHKHPTVPPLNAADVVIFVVQDARPFIREELKKAEIDLRVGHRPPRA